MKTIFQEDPTKLYIIIGNDGRVKKWIAGTGSELEDIKRRIGTRKGFKVLVFDAETETVQPVQL